MIDIHNLNLFVKAYFNHPIWKHLELDNGEEWIRLTFAYSDYLKKKLRESSSSSAAEVPWHYTDKVFTRSAWEAGKLASFVDLANSKAMHCYYSRNLSPINFGVSSDARGDENGGGAQYILRARESHITNVLFLGLDWDYQLPCGILKIFNEIGIKPWIIYSTSEVPGTTKYQALIAVDVSESTKFLEWKTLGRKLAYELGCDMSGSDLNRVFRLPGTINWKGAETGKHSGKSLVKHVADVADASGDSVYAYTLDALNSVIQNLGSNDICNQLKTLAANLSNTIGNKSRSHRSESSTDISSKLFPVPWKDALRSVRSGGDPIASRIIAHRGERHTALTSWAGGLATEVGRGLFDATEAAAVLGELAVNACEAGSELVGMELDNLCQFIRVCADKDHAQRIAMIAEMIPESVALNGTSNGNRDSKDLNGSIGKHSGKESAFGSINLVQTIGSDKESKQQSSSPSSTSSRASSRSHARSRTVLFKNETPLADLLLTRLQQFTERHPSESEGEWAGFLIAFFMGVKELKNRGGTSSGMTKKVVDTLMHRAEKLGYRQAFGFYLPDRFTNAWGIECGGLIGLTEAQLEDYFDQVLQILVDKASDDPLVRRAGEFEDVRRAILRKCQEKCVVPDSASDDASGGGPRVDEERLTALIESSLDDYFDISLSGSIKAGIVKRLVTSCSVWKEARGVTSGSVAFQNGYYSYEDGRWTACEAWRECTDSCACYFDVELAKEFSGILNSCLVLGAGAAVGASAGSLYKLDSAAFETILASTCPAFYKFVSEAFPNDCGTWVLLLCILGYSLLSDNPFQIFFGFHGASGAGKTTLAELVGMLVGERKTTSLRFEDVAADKGGLAHCVDKMVCIVDEAESDNRALHNKVFARLKEVTGARRAIHVEHKYEHGFNVLMTTKFFLCSNPAYLFSDSSDAVRRRFVDLYFGTPAKVMDEGLKLKILHDQHVVRERGAGGGAGVDKLPTLAAVLCRWLWPLKAGMFHGATSKALSEGQEDLAMSSNPLRFVLGKILEPANDRICLPLAVIKSALACIAEKSSDAIGSACDSFVQHNDIVIGRELAGILRNLGIEYDRETSRIRVLIEGKNVTLRCVRGHTLNVQGLQIFGVSIDDVFRVLAENNLLVSEWWREYKDG